MDNGKRILILSLAYYPKYVGGAEVAIKEITDRIAPSSITFDMICLRFDSALPRIEQIGNVRVHRLGWSVANPTPRIMRSLRYRVLKLWFQFAAARYAKKLHRREPYDAVWAMMAHSCGVPGYLIKKSCRIPLILTLQEGDPIEHVEKTMRPLWPWFTRAFRQADVVQSISNFLGTWARRRGFRGPVAVIPNGVDIKLFLGEPVAHDGVVLITTSRLVYKNGIDLIIRALHQLPGVRFRILGVGSEEANLRALAAEEGVADRIEFLGYVPHEALPAYLHSADIFIRPSRSEGLGNSFVEAFAAGIPVIATQVGGIADLLFDAVKNPEREATGYAVDPESPNDIARAVRTIVENPHEALQVVAHARRFAASNFDWDHVVKRMQDEVFERVLQK